MNLLYPVLKKDCRQLPRDESKIKSYDSCSDIRAWSHEERTRDIYLREWMKCDMQNIFPIGTLTYFVRNMTCSSRSRTTPRCHPNCKSKVLLESICTSCQAIKSCLRNDTKFDKYFAEEEHETSHWPCDKCLEVIKSIKLFWKIIADRIFGVSLTKNNEFDIIQDCRTENVKSVSKLWEREIVQQASFVKNVTPLLNKGLNRTDSPWTNLCKKQSSINVSSKVSMAANKPESLNNNSSHKSGTGFISQTKSKSSNCGKSSNSLNRKSSKYKVHKCTSIRVGTGDVACVCRIESDELKTVKNNLQYLEEKCNDQNNEIDQLRKENISLKHQKDYSDKFPHLSPNVSLSDCHKSVSIPTPFENFIDDNKKKQSVDCAESEMIITMKNCRNETFKHVSLLQVLHKTNDPIIITKEIITQEDEMRLKEDPVQLLTKVQDTFGEMVRREMYNINNKDQSTKHSDITTTFHSLNNSSSAPSCSTICTDSRSLAISESFSKCGL